jgi:Ser/Thr protein kinase RdoA (MazF antagonist)
VRAARVGAALAEVGAPVVRPLAPDPVVVDGAAVTFWELLDVGSTVVSAGELGGLAAALHRRSLALVDAGLPALDPHQAIATQLERARAAGATAADDLDRLGAALAHLRSQWPAAVASVGGARAVVHGDLHVGNAVTTPSGPVLVDLELAGVGPAAYDVAPAVVAVRRYGAPDAELTAFLAAVGEDPTGRPGFEVLVRTTELWLTAWAVGTRHLAPELDEEAGRRLAAWGPGPVPTWRLR